MIYFRKYSKQFLLELFFSVVLFELFLGGGGRLVMIGPLTLRMLLFSVLIVISGILLINKVKIDIVYFRLLMLYFILILFAGVLGYFHHATPVAIFTDIKPLLYFLSILFFAIIIKSYNQIEIIFRIIKISAVILALTYLILMFLIVCKILTFDQIYYLSDSKFYSEFIFNGTLGCFYYKGFIFLSIGFFFYFIEDSVFSKITSLLILISIFFTLSRGLVIDLLIMDLCYVFFKRKKGIKWKYHLVLIALLLLYLTFYGWFRFYGNGFQLMGDKTSSNLERVNQIKEVYENTNFTSFFIGHGFGIGVPSKDVHMEITYLEILNKQGLIGLSFWLYLLINILLNFKKLINNSEVCNKTIPLLFAVLIIYLHSLTNPYLMNPIGISIVLIGYISFNVLSKNEKI